MELNAEATTLVVAGAWNAAILTPTWMLHHGFNNEAAPPDPSRVQIFFPALAGGAFEFPRYTLEAFSYIVRPDTLIVLPNGEPPRSLEIAEDAVARVLEVLSHTPITGVGHNFEFRETNPRPQDVEVFSHSRQDLVDHIEVGWAPAATALATSLRNEATGVLINIQRQLEDGVMAVKFNFHHAVTSGAEAVSVLHGQAGKARMSANLDMARGLIQTLYGVAAQ